MRTVNFSILLILSLMQNAFAEGLLPHPEGSDYRRRFGISLGITYNSKNFGPSQNYDQLSPEIAGYYYHRITPEWLLRPGFRLAYTSTDPTQNVPSAILIHEADLTAVGEISFQWRIYSVIPTLTLGAGWVHRSTSLQTQAPVTVIDNSIDGNAWFLRGQVQFAIVLPIEDGQFEITPFGRYSLIFNDPRTRWYGGLEASFGIF